MSITLITGVPGSGKSLKAVWDHVRPLIGKTQKSEDEWGRIFEIPNIVFTNINSLQIDHELIEGGGTWSLERKPEKIVAGESGNFARLITAPGGWAYDGNALGLRNWQNWAKPGNVICFDEFQKFWPPRPNGSAIPPDIQALDTHRHMGVNFILITQNCKNVDRHILGLVDRHLHVRRVANMPLAVVYEWDHASVNLNYKNSFTKSPWRFPKQAYKLYKSAELHTKQARKLPGLVWFVLAGLAGAAYAVPTLKERISDRIGGKPPAVQKSGIAPGAKTTYEKDGVTYTVESVTEPAPLPISAASAPVVVATPPAPAGCIVVRSRCGCMDATGQSLQVEPGVCEQISGAGRGKPIEFADTPRFREPDASEVDALQFAFARK